MILISPAEVSRGIHTWFKSDLPAILRFYAVLQGIAPGRILTDDQMHPAQFVVQEAFDGTIYLGGTFEAAQIAELIAQLRQTGDVLYGFRDGRDPHQHLFPTPEYDGRVLEFFDRPIGEGLDVFLKAVPEGCEIRPFDRALFDRTEDYALNVALHGSPEKAFERLTGFCLMRGDEILSEATSGPPVNGFMEPGTSTRKEYRCKGYATIACAALIQECEKRGYQTYWNCAKQNIASAALARKLGYRTEREYRLYAWFKSNPE